MKKIIFLLATLLLSTTTWAQNDCSTTVFGIATVSQTSVPAAAFEGKFSVSAYKTVKFSPGNLHFHGIYGSDGYFYFTANQWEYVYGTCCNCNDANANTGLFGYGTSGYQEGLYQENPPTVCWSDDFDDVVNRMAPQNLDGTNYDWGVHNPIQYGDKTYEAGLWRTLTKDEWEYLLSKRPNFANLRSAGKVNNVLGLIILPDEWTLPNGQSFYPLLSIDQVNIDNTANANVYTTEQWEVMENAGAIFLPAAGHSGGSKNEFCCYITATQNGNTQMYRMDFGRDDIDPRYVTANKNERSAVRLVQDFK